MVRKASWILVLLVALLVLSATAAFAAGMTRPAPITVTPEQGISSVGTIHGLGGSNYDNSDDGNCPFHSDSAAAY